ncbi:MAG TPA: META domain-containing protein [Terriglobales bacterium]|nr:META domain-containing protein [Terriglobales bacterium]
MKTTRLKLVLGVGLAVGLIGGLFAQETSGGAGDLAGTTWQLVKFQGGDDKTLTPTDKSKYTMAFEKDSVSVRIDCNRGHGSWKSAGPNQLEFGPMALTRAMCPPAELTDRLPRDWGYVRSYVMRDSHLFLSLMADGGMYEFEPRGAAGAVIKGTAADRPVRLENNDWKLTELGGTAVAPGAHQPHFILSSKTHHLSGAGGCNRVMGSYEMKDEQLTFSQMVSTMMACPQGMDTEKTFLDALRKAQRWKIEGQNLALMDGDGQVVARFSRHSVKIEAALAH